MTTKEEDLNVDSLIARLLEVRGCRPGKVVQMTEAEVRSVFAYYAGQETAAVLLARPREKKNSFVPRKDSSGASQGSLGCSL